MRCGLDLARVRAAPDPHYGLPLAICPRCSWACVRRVTLLAGQRRALRRAIEAGAQLILQISMVLLFTATTCINAFELQSIWFLTWDESWLRWNWMFLVWALLIVPHLTGAWLTTAFGHHRLVVVFLLWGTWLLAWLIVPGCVIPALEYLTGTLDEINAIVLADDVARQLARRAWEDIRTVGTLIAATAVFGLPLCGFYQSQLLIRRRKRRARVRRRLRKWRCLS